MYRGCTDVKRLPARTAGVASRGDGNATAHAVWAIEEYPGLERKLRYPPRLNGRERSEPPGKPPKEASLRRDAHHGHHPES